MTDYPAPPSLETARLRLIPADVDDATALFPVFSDAAAMDGWGQRTHETPEDTRHMLHNFQHKMHLPQWGVYLKRGRQAAGVAIGHITLHGSAVPGMGYLVRSDYWRQGYGSEAVAAVLGYVFTTLEYPRLELWIHADNIPSQRLAYRVGFRPRGQFTGQHWKTQRPRETIVFGLRAEEWAVSNSVANGVRGWGLGKSDGVSSRAPDQIDLAPSQLHLAEPERAFYGVEPEIGVRDVEATADYYRDVLGFVQTDEDWNEDYTRVVGISMARGEWSWERAAIHFRQMDNPPPPGTLFLPVGGGLQTWCDELAARGVNIAQAIRPVGIGRLQFTIVDLNGWRLRFVGVVP